MLSIYIVSLNFCDYSRWWPAAPRRVSRKKMFFASQSHVITTHEKWAFCFNNTLTWPQEFEHVQYNLLAFHRNSSLILFINEIYVDIL